MENDVKKYSLYLIAIVAIVAIVGIVVMTTNFGDLSTTTAVSEESATSTEDSEESVTTTEEADLAGQAINVEYGEYGNGQCEYQELNDYPDDCKKEINYPLRITNVKLYDAHTMSFKLSNVANFATYKIHLTAMSLIFEANGFNYLTSEAIPAFNQWIIPGQTIEVKVTTAGQNPSFVRGNCGEKIGIGIVSEVSQKKIYKSLIYVVPNCKDFNK